MADNGRQRQGSNALRSTNNAFTIDNLDNGPGAHWQREADRAVQEAATGIQVIELTSFFEQRRGDNGLSTPSVETLAVTYALSHRTTLPSRDDQQSIRIAVMPLDATFYRLAAPLLTDYVYEHADVANTSDRVLLAGPVSCYLDDRFVGGDQVPTVAIGEQFTLGLGIDSTMRTARKLIEKSEKIQGGNRVVTYAYVLSVTNFSDDAAPVRLIDRIPQADPPQLKVTLTATDPPLSKDEKYQKEQRPQGLLRWDLVAPANSMSLDAQLVEYEYTLEYAKDRALRQ